MGLDAMRWSLRRGWLPCTCTAGHRTRFLAVTGGPGAGKTALLDALRQSLCEHVIVLPEAARIVFAGGFPRLDDEAVLRAGQRAIYRVQAELETIAVEHDRVAIALCDRGRLDGLAYWPGDPERYFAELGTTRAAELARYDAVVHLRPAPPSAYASGDPVRVESAAQAGAADARIEEAWAEHPVRLFVDASTSFEQKLATAMSIVREVLPPCCRVHVGQRTIAGGLDCAP